MAVVVVAAGSGSRLGATVPKAFVRVGGRSLLAWSLDGALGCSGLVGIVVVAPPGLLPDAEDEVSGYRGAPVRVVAGGAERSDSVAAGLAALPAGADVVLVHDAARALAPRSLFAEVVAAVRAGHPAVVPGLAVVDTIKQVGADGTVVATPDRASLRAVQTPQGFSREVLLRAHASAVTGATDDAALVEALGLPVVVVPGDPTAAKITTTEDLERAERLLLTRTGQVTA